MEALNFIIIPVEVVRRNRGAFLAGSTSDFRYWFEEFDEQLPHGDGPLKWLISTGSTR